MADINEFGIVSKQLIKTKNELSQTKMTLNLTVGELEMTKANYETIFEAFKNSEDTIKHLNSEIDELKRNLNISQTVDSDLKKILENIKKKNEELTNLNSQKEKKIQELQETLSEKDKIIEDQNTHLEQIKAELNNLKPPEVITVDVGERERVSCPTCGAVGKDIKIEEDKSKVLSYIGNAPMYAKKHVCKKCGFEF